jgi:hypothetical protein
MDHPEITKIYKYRSFSDRNLNMLENNQLYFAASFTFNDPFDCRARKEFEFTDDNDLIEKMAPLEAAHQSIAVDQAVEYLKRIIADNRKEEYLGEKSSLFQKLVLELYGICSFSEVSNDILMWSHYPDGHQGFCLEFERSPDNMLQWVRPVEYPENDEFPYVEYWRQKPNEQIDEFSRIVTTKSKHWSYEKEWRALDRPDQIDEQYRGHIKNYPEAMLTGVIFGVRMLAENRQRIKEILAGRNADLYEAKIVRNRFQIEVVTEAND